MVAKLDWLGLARWTLPVLTDVPGSWGKYDMSKLYFNKRFVETMHVTQHDTCLVVLQTEETDSTACGHM